ncbi:MAG: NAD(P)H-hydrate dehydratase [Bdellovibrionota bacterium]
MPHPIFGRTTEIQEIEENCFNNGMPRAALMEKAGLKSFVIFKELYPKHDFLKILIFVGPGHNGGDALVIARELLLSGYKTYVFVPEAKLKKLTEEHLNYYLFLGGQVFSSLNNIYDIDVIIDGLFGFGLNRNLEQKFIDIIETINIAGKEIVSLDLPSGMHADFGTALGACIQATHTFCLGIYKYGLIQDYAVDYVGKLHFIDLGFKKNNLQVMALNQKTIQQLNKNIPVQKRNLNKYSNGVCLLFAGSNKYPGAGILSARGAMASGAGYVQLCCTEETKYTFTTQIPDIICSGLNDMLAQIERHIQNPNFSILCGSGLEDNNYLKLIIEKIYSLNSHFPCLILDASTLNEKNYLFIQKYKGQKILTPHMGEFSKIFPHIHEKMIKNEAHAVGPFSLDKIGAVQAAAKEINGIVLLKGPHSVIGNAHGEVYVNIKSTSALARAGCGDVLSGYIAGLTAKGYSPFHAACFGVFEQCKTAIYLEEQFGTAYVCASNLAKQLEHEL